jgi:glutamate synthase domain-containing protein 2
MRHQFLLSIIPIHAAIFALGYYLHHLWYYAYIVSIPLTLLGLRDVFFQKKHTILSNYPVLGHFRYLLEEIRPEIQQYFIERFNDGKPFSREQRSVIYQRAKGALDTSAFGTQLDVYQTGAEWLEHSLNVTDEMQLKDRVMVGNDQCKKPYSCSRFNISAMSYGSLSKNAVMALNKGAHLGDFYHNTGEGGISPYHEKYGADLVWQIGTAYFGCRNSDGTFNEEMFAKKAQQEQVKMIELKMSQGAKPGHGGMLPASKVNAEVAAIRAVEVGKDVNSPPKHSAFNTPREMMKFIQKLRELSGGKPVGFKLCLGRYQEFMSLIKAMKEEDIYPDFITIDGSEGGTGAAPREFSNYLGTPLNDALNFIHNTLKATGIRHKMKLIASGKIFDAFSMTIKFSLGADICNSARGMMFAIGCIQALRCNSNNCPAGVATQDPKLYKLLDVTDKGERVARYHARTIQELHHMLAAAGVSKLSELNKEHIKRRVGPGKIVSYNDIFPNMETDDLINGHGIERYQHMWNEASADQF